MTDTLVTLSKELESKSEIIFILTIHLILFIICLSLLFQIVHLAGLSLLKLENATNILHLKYPGLKPGPLVRQLFLPMETWPLFQTVPPMIFWLTSLKAQNLLGLEDTKTKVLLGCGVMGHHGNMSPGTLPNLAMNAAMKSIL